MHSFSGWLKEDGDPSFLANFSQGVSSFGADFAGVSQPSAVRLYAYNGSTLLGSVFGNSGAISTGQFMLSITNSTPITSVVIANDAFDDWGGVDNIRYTTAVTAVPEPNSVLRSPIDSAVDGSCQN